MTPEEAVSLWEQTDQMVQYAPNTDEVRQDHNRSTMLPGPRPVEPCPLCLLAPGNHVPGCPARVRYSAGGFR